MTINPNNGKVYVANHFSGLMYVINGKDDKLVKTLYVGKKPWDVQCSVCSR